MRSIRHGMSHEKCDKTFENKSKSHSLGVITFDFVTLIEFVK